MVCLLKMVIFHGYVSHNQMVGPGVLASWHDCAISWGLRVDTLGQEVMDCPIWPCAGDGVIWLLYPKVQWSIIMFHWMFRTSLAILWVQYTIWDRSKCDCQEMGSSPQFHYFNDEPIICRLSHVPFKVNIHKLGMQYAPFLNNFLLSSFEGKKHDRDMEKLICSCMASANRCFEIFWGQEICKILWIS